MRSIIPAIILLAAITFAGCNNRQVDLIIYNARIISLDSVNAYPEAFAVKDGKFVAVGTTGEILSRYHSGTTIDLHGKYVYPGFIDAHCHFYGYGLGLQWADLQGMKSFNEIIEKLKQHQEKYHGEWILGRGWDQNLWKVKAFPDKKLLDEAFPNNPVVLTRIDGHAIIANSAALLRANITSHTVIKGGEIVQKNNRLTGVLIDNAAEYVLKFVPKPGNRDKVNALLQAQRNCFSVGLTTVDDAGLNAATIQLIDSLQKSGMLKMRIYAMVGDSIKSIYKYMRKGCYKTDFLNVRSIKLYADGALGSRGALLLEPYSDDNSKYGLLLTPVDSLRWICSQALSLGFQVNTHCIGDSSNRLVLSIYGSLLKGKNDLRWRIEHAQVIDEADFGLFGKYSVIPSIQATHATSDMYWAMDRLGPKRIKNAYAYKRLKDQNGWLAGGSDFPVENINPVLGFYAAVVRKDLKGFPNDRFNPENAITRLDALKSMTLWAARANFEEHEKGSIETGKFADFLISTFSLLNMDESQIPEFKVDEVFVGGKSVFARKQ